MQRLEGLLRKAVQDYEMIAPGDRGMRWCFRREGQRCADRGAGTPAAVSRRSV